MAVVALGVLQAGSGLRWAAGCDGQLGRGSLAIRLTRMHASWWCHMQNKSPASDLAEFAWDSPVNAHVALMTSLIKSKATWEDGGLLQHNCGR